LKYGNANTVLITDLTFFISGSCFTIALTIYGYTMYAIKQEKFLDDFDMPDPLAEDVRAKKIK